MFFVDRKFLIPVFQSHSQVLTPLDQNSFYPLLRISKNYIFATCHEYIIDFFFVQPLVVKPDQLIKRRGKLGLIAVNKNFQQVKQWVNERMGKDQKIGNAVGKLRNFIIEPFVPHKDAEEAYVCIYSHRTADTILFYHQGGVDVGDVDSKALKLEVTVGSTLSMDDIEKKLLTEISAAKKP